MNTTKWAAKAEQIVLAPLERCTQEKAAAALGMSTTTIWRWWKKPEFQELYRKARRDAFAQVKGRARFAAPSAAANLIAVLLDPKAPPAAQLRASCAILKLANTFEFEELKASVEDMMTQREEEEREEREETEKDISHATQENSTFLCEGKRTPRRSGAHGVSTTTVWRLSQKPEFQERYLKMRDEKYSFALSFLQQAANTAMSTLIRLSNDKDFRIRIRASEAIFELARTGVTEELESAVADLERTESEFEKERNKERPSEEKYKERPTPKSLEPA